MSDNKSSVRGRKPQHEHLTKKPILYVRADRDTHAKVVLKCRQLDISINQYITDLIKRDLEL